MRTIGLLGLLPVLALLLSQNSLAQNSAQMEYERQQREYRQQTERQQEQQRQLQRQMEENARRQQEEMRRLNTPPPATYSPPAPTYSSPSAQAQGSTTTSRQDLNAPQGWVKIEGASPGVVYADLASVKTRSANIVQMRELKSWKTRLKLYGVEFYSAKRTSEYDCARKQLRTVHVTAFSGPMGEGTVLHTGPEVEPWRPAAGSYVNEELLRLACRGPKS